MSGTRIVIAFEHTHTSAPFTSGTNEIFNDLLSTWRVYTGGFFNSDSTSPEWYDHIGEEIEYTVRIIAYIDAGVATEYFKLVGPEKFLEVSGITRWVDRHDLKNLRIE